MKKLKKPSQKFRFGSPLGLTQSNSNKALPKSSQAVGLKNKGKLSRATVKPIKGWRRFIPFYGRFHFSWRKFFWWSFGLLIALIIGVTATFAYFVRDLPNPRQISIIPSQSTRILDRNGKDLYNIHGEQNRTVIKGDQISKNLKDATVAVEDASFYTNHGFDLKGIARALVNRVTHQGLAGGGSTITQQYIKNTLLTNEETYSRKIKELILAIEVEQNYTKDEILTGYLNQIPYGSNAYGIEAASQTYFGKNAKDLTLSEAATLAGIPQAPTYYSPYGNHLDDLFARKNYILDRMVKVGSITQKQADEAKKAAPSAAEPNFRHQSDLVAPHFVFYVREELIKYLGGDPQKAEQTLDEAGYTVTTSLDIDTQNMAQDIVSKMGPDVVKKYKATNASLSAVDPKTGEILAMVGSIDYENSRSGNTNFANALLQPGSSFKPIVYATAFGPKYKYSPASITFDLPTDFGNYKPSNYDGKFRGPITNRMALDGSLNIPAVKNLYLVGIDQALATAKSMGITTLNRPAGEYGLSLVLGSGEVKPIEMAGAYATFANGGQHNPLRPILKIVKDGKVIKDYTTTPAVKALEPETAYEINNVLSDNNSRAYIFGSKNNLTLADRPVAAKSGTTENNRDAWTIGYTPSISVAVWVGNNDDNKTMVKGADGSYVAAPIWNAFMKEYLKGKPVEQFNRPSTIKDVTVDRLSGKLPTDQSPSDQHITDIFAPWQIPTTNDDVHVKLKLDKTTGKLATDLTPADSIIEQFFITIHSEAPDKPGWELPVQEWARANGAGTPPPTEKDNVHTQDAQPTISFVSPTNGGTISGNFTLESTPSSSHPITKVEYLINGTSVGSVTSAPWSMTYDANSLPAGSQIIIATATNDIGMTKSDQITVNRVEDSSPPAPVTSPTAVYTVPNKNINLSWTNPDSPDLASVNIYQSLSSDPTDQGVKINNVAATPGSAGSLTFEVTPPPAGKAYYYLIKPVDSSGNENASAVKIPVN